MEKTMTQEEIERGLEEGNLIEVKKPKRLALWIDKDNVVNCKGVDGKIELPQEGYKNTNFAAAEKAIVAMYGNQPVWGLMRHGKNKWSILA